MKKLIVSLLISCFALSGCQSYSEIEDTYLVSAISIDQGKSENYLVTVEIVEMNEMGDQTSPKAKLLSSEGETILGALHEISVAASKKIFLSQNAAIIVSETLAKKEGMVPTINLILHEIELRLTNDIIIAHGCTANQLLSLNSTGSDIRGYEIKDILKNSAKQLSIIPEIQAYQFINTLGTEGICPVLPAFGYEQAKEKQSLSIYGSAIFKNGKLSDLLGVRESNFLTILLGKAENSTITVKVPGEKDNYLSLHTYHCKSKVVPEIDGKNVKMKVTINVDAAVNVLTEKENLLIKKDEKKLVEKMEKSLKKDFEDFIKKAQTQYKADIFGFGDKIYKKSPKTWEKLKKTDYFSNIDTQVNINLNLISSGFINKSSKKGNSIIAEEGNEGE
ncbi:MAG: Ger(x)C family spore germination protein [Bacillota bacterium]|nr:Ger(x)C family spore germination protein [Bacillota bacterium]